MIISILLILLGFAFLIKGADLLVEGSSNIAKKFHIPEIIIGLTIVSMGTSMPELFVSITSAIEGHSDMAMGNVIGSNVCNLLLILGLSTVIKPVKFQRETRLIEIPLCLAFTLIFMALCNIDYNVTKVEGIVLVVLFVMFIAYTIIMAKKGEKFDSKGEEQVYEVDTSNISIIKNLIYVIVGIIGLKFGGDFTVDNAVIIAREWGISEQIISLTILAVRNKPPRTCNKCYGCN